MKIQSSISDSQMYSPSRQSRVLGGLSAPSTPPNPWAGRDTNNSMAAAARGMSSQMKSAANKQMADANLANQLQSQRARSQDLQSLTALNAQQYGDMAQRRNAYTNLGAQNRVNQIGNAGTQMGMAMDWVNSILGGLMR
jgi:hypothetical protein